MIIIQKKIINKKEKKEDENINNKDKNFIHETNYPDDN